MKITPVVISISPKLKFIEIDVVLAFLTCSIPYAQSKRKNANKAKATYLLHP